MQLRRLYSTKWLSDKLGISVATIERLRAAGSCDIPPHIVIGNGCIRYADLDVEAWIQSRLQPTPASNSAAGDQKGEEKDDA